MVEEGNRVKKGEVIARLENDDVLAARSQAEANLNAVRYNLEQVKAELSDAAVSFERNKSLIEKGFVSKAEYDASEARYRKASAAVSAAGAEVKAGNAALQSANVAVEYTLIRAPFDAVVLTKNADIGDIVTPIGAAADAKAAVVSIADMDSLLVEVDVSESNIYMVKTGQPSEIQLDALPDSRFRGSVHMIVPTADRTKATILVKVRFIDKDSRILPEMSAKVAFLSREIKDDEQKPRTAFNPAAVIDRKGKTSVFLIRENRVIEKPVTLGEKLGDMVEVLSGVKAGDRIVLKPLDKVKDGSRIKIAEK
jgi:RND family efflux transporter MFP subunit